APPWGSEGAHAHLSISTGGAIGKKLTIDRRLSSERVIKRWQGARALVLTWLWFLCLGQDSTSRDHDVQ
ncbi:MAG: hypothetical protein Q6373_024420, partial [Candidatus Sigynarchaeota archaeon]